MVLLVHPAEAAVLDCSAGKWSPLGPGDVCPQSLGMATQEGGFEGGFKHELSRFCGVENCICMSFDKGHLAGTWLCYQAVAAHRGDTSKGCSSWKCTWRLLIVWLHILETHLKAADFGKAHLGCIYWLLIFEMHILETHLKAAHLGKAHLGCIYWRCSRRPLWK
eukprot:1145327-Pelagomonas_calceolata.AAC.3